MTTVPVIVATSQPGKLGEPWRFWLRSQDRPVRLPRWRVGEPVGEALGQRHDGLVEVEVFWLSANCGYGSRQSLKLVSCWTFCASGGKVWPSE